MDHSVDVSGLPEPYVRAIRAVVEAFRRELATKATAQKTPARRVALSLCEGRAVGNLSREEIYDDVR
jgi:hypothetical protein